MNIVETPVIKNIHSRYSPHQSMLIKILNNACDKYAMSKREYDTYSIYSFNITDDIDELHTIGVYDRYIDYAIDSIDMDEEVTNTYYYSDRHDLVELIATNVSRLPGKYEQYKINHYSDDSSD